MAANTAVRAALAATMASMEAKGYMKPADPAKLCSCHSGGGDVRISFRHCDVVPMRDENGEPLPDKPTSELSMLSRNELIARFAR